MQFEKAQREMARGLILLALHNARPLGATDALILRCLNGVPHQITALQLRQNISYLEDKGLLTCNRKNPNVWHCSLTSYGVDVMEYACECPVGVSISPKYWEENNGTTI